MNGQLHRSLENAWLASAVSFALIFFFTGVFFVLPHPLPSMKNHHFGLLRMDTHPLNALRIVGALLPHRRRCAHREVPNAGAGLRRTSVAWADGASGPPPSA